MPLLTIGGLADYQTHVLSQNRRYVLFNVTFPANPPGFTGIPNSPETIRLNVDGFEITYKRGSLPRPLQFRVTDASPFQLRPDTFAVTISDLRDWCNNFHRLREAVGTTDLGDIKTSDRANDPILRHLQMCVTDLLDYQRLLTTLPVETNLYRAYHASNNPLSLVTGGTVTSTALQLLQDARDALAVYAQVPELGLALREGGGTGQPTQHGALLRHYLQSHPLALGGGLEYVDHEVRPLRLSPLSWSMNGGGGIRKDAVDLLLAYQNVPVVAETKMKDDKWPTAGFQQVLYYGSMLANGPQRQRLRRQYVGRFPSDARLWLALIVESRADQTWRQDLQQVIDFAHDHTTATHLGGSFAGLLIIEVTETGAGTHQWRANQPLAIRW